MNKQTHRSFSPRSVVLGGVVLALLSTFALVPWVSSTLAQDGVRAGASEPLKVLHEFGPNAASQKTTDLDWSTLQIVASVLSESFEIHLLTGEDFAGLAMAMIVVLEPETEVDGWRPRSALASPVETTGATMLDIGTPSGEAYVGFLNATPAQPLVYRDEEGLLKEVNINAPDGIAFLPGAKEGYSQAHQSGSSSSVGEAN